MKRGPHRPMQVYSPAGELLPWTRAKRPAPCWCAFMPGKGRGGIAWRRLYRRLAIEAGYRVRRG